MTDKKQDKEETIKKLADIEKQLGKLATEYNKLAKKIDFESRVAIGRASYEIEDYEYDDDYKRPKNLEKAISEGEIEVYASLDDHGAYAWFPSSIGC